MGVLIRLKKELFHLRKAFFVYHSGPRYFYNKFLVAPKILRSKKVFLTESAAVSSDLSLHLLTGHNDLVMALWSLASFFTQTSIRGRFYVHNDGSLRRKDLEIISRLFPQSHAVSPKEAAAAVQEFYHQCPNTLRLYGAGRFVLLKKLLDPSAVSKSRMHLIIDSDLVWFKEPKELEAALASGLPHPLMMRNNGITLVRFMDGSRISEEQAEFNSGIVAFHSEQFSLARLEEFFGKLDLADAQTPHFLEQAGYAYALLDPASLSPERYTIKGGYSEGLALKHYTSPRRPLFYLEALPKLYRQFFN